MKLNNTLIHTIQFHEQTAVSKEHSENALFDILQEHGTDNTSYCQALINKAFVLHKK